jgi:putative transposase
LNSKLHAVCDQLGRPILLRLTAGQVSDHKGAAMMLDDLPAAAYLIADRGYDSAGFRQALTDMNIVPCIPSSRSRKRAFPYDKAIYRQRHRIENMFAHLKDWRRVATRYDRCAHTFFAAICIAATVIFWINES